MMTGKYAKVPCISAMHNCLATALRGIRQGPAWHYARHLCMAKYRSRRNRAPPSLALVSPMNDEVYAPFRVSNESPLVDAFPHFRSSLYPQ